jgi:magnesium chelatase family protein
MAVSPSGNGGRLVTVEAAVTPGLSETILVGLPETSAWETSARVRAAILNSGGRWPDGKISVTISPATLPRRASAFDLAIAIAVMVANGDLPELPGGLLFLAELGLDGRLRPLPGVMLAPIAAVVTGRNTVVVSAADFVEASKACRINLIAAESLTDVASWLRAGRRPGLPCLPVRALEQDGR